MKIILTRTRDIAVSRSATSFLCIHKYKGISWALANGHAHRQNADIRLMGIGGSSLSQHKMSGEFNAAT